MPLLNEAIGKIVQGIQYDPSHCVMTKSIVVEALELAEKQFVREGYNVTGPARTSVAKAILVAEIEHRLWTLCAFTLLRMDPRIAALLAEHEEATKP